MHPLVRAPSTMSHRSRSRDREVDQLRKQLQDATTTLDAARVALEDEEDDHDATKEQLEAALLSNDEAKLDDVDGIREKSRTRRRS